jgi:heat shock protein HspQ
MKLEPKIELAKQYDSYVNNKIQYQQQQQEEEPVYITKPTKEKKKKIIYKEVEEEDEEEEIVYIKKNKPKQETLDRTLYKSSTEQLHMRAVEERIKHNLTSCYSALMPREY